jgi:pyruvate/2-oxoglutarate dehydrogenase complex dihydrolipoamide dehydrogenase (E3) component
VTAHIEVGGKVEKQEFDTVISAVGIVGNTEGLGLEALGVKVDRTHVVTDPSAAPASRGSMPSATSPARPGWRTRPATRA